MDRPSSTARFILVLSLLLIVVFLLSVCLGAVKIGLDEIASALKKWAQGSSDLTMNERIFLWIRLPRAILTVITGATLAAGGALHQALFRNPIVEPGLIGTSSGAAFGAALYFVLGSVIGFSAGEWTLRVAERCSRAELERVGDRAADRQIAGAHRHGPTRTHGHRPL